MTNLRIGLPTASNIWKLMDMGERKMTELELSAHRAANPTSRKQNIETHDVFGKAAETYIKQKRREIRLNGEIDGIEVTSRSLSWGRMGELYVFGTYLPSSFQLLSDVSILHPSGFFSGRPDIKDQQAGITGDIKCPFTRDSYCDLVETIERGDPEFFKKERPEYYWQIVSGAMLNGHEKGALVIWMPYFDELHQIRIFVDAFDFEAQRLFQLRNDLYWVTVESDKRIPHLPEGTKLSNYYHWDFDIPQKDVELVLAKTEMAYKRINNKL